MQFVTCVPSACTNGTLTGTRSLLLAALQMFPDVETAANHWFTVGSGTAPPAAPGPVMGVPVNNTNNQLVNTQNNDAPQREPRHPARPQN